LIDAIQSLARCVALGDGRDPAEASPTDRDKAIDFLNLFAAATYWARQRDPCHFCNGSGVEPLVGKVHPPPVIPKAA
jgi:hypothetical protein